MAGILMSWIANFHDRQTLLRRGKVTEHVRVHLWHFARIYSREDKDERAEVHSPGRHVLCQEGLCEVCHKGMHAPCCMQGVLLHKGHCVG